MKLLVHNKSSVLVKLDYNTLWIIMTIRLFVTALSIFYAFTKVNDQRFPGMHKSQGPLCFHSGSCKHMGRAYGIGESWMTGDCYQCVCMEPFGVGCCDQWVWFAVLITLHFNPCRYSPSNLTLPTVALNLWTTQTGVRSFANLTLALVLQWWESIGSYRVSGDENTFDQLQRRHGNLTMILCFEFSSEWKW